MKFAVKVPENAALTRPYFTRKGIQEPRYTVSDQSQLHRPAAEAALVAVATFEVNGVPVEMREPVKWLEANLPYGYDTRVLAVVPAIAVTMSPAQAVVPLAMAEKQVKLRTEILNNTEGKSEGTLSLNVPAGWKVEPASQPFVFAHAGERAYFPFTVTIPSLEAGLAVPQRSFSGGAADDDVHMAEARTTVNAKRAFMGQVRS